MSRILDMWAGMTGTVLDFAGTDAPDGWLMCFGQSVLRSDYPNLFAKIGTTFGAADGTHFNLPDYRGRVAAGKDDMGGVAAGRVTAAGAGINGAQLGATGGVETHTLTAAQMPQHSHAVTDPGHTHGITDPGHVHVLTDPGHNHAVTDPGHNHNVNANYYGLSALGSGTQTPYCAPGQTVSGGANIAAATGVSIQARTTGITMASKTAGVTANTGATGITTQNAGTGGAHQNVQPTLMLNKIIKT